MHPHLKVFLLFALLSTDAFAQPDSLRVQIERFITGKRAEIGVGVYHFETWERFSIGESRHYPMQSVFKFHLALAILHDVDTKRFSLEQIVRFSKKDLDEDTWSPMRDSFPRGSKKMT